MYEELTLQIFLSGYLSVLDTVMAGQKYMMLKHLKEIMVDTELYGWEAVSSYYAAWLQQLKYSRANREWADYEVKMQFRRSLVWHSVARGTKVKQLPSARGFKKPTMENLSKVVPATLQTWSCTP